MANKEMEGMFDNLVAMRNMVTQWDQSLRWLLQNQNKRDSANEVGKPKSQVMSADVIARFHIFAACHNLLSNFTILRKKLCVFKLCVFNSPL